MTILTNRLRLIAPVIMDHGIDYERGKFQDKLNDGSLTLARTEVMPFRLFPLFPLFLLFLLFLLFPLSLPISLEIEF